MLESRRKKMKIKFRDSCSPTIFLYGKLLALNSYLEVLSQTKKERRSEKMKFRDICRTTIFFYGKLLSFDRYPGVLREKKKKKTL